MLTYNRGQWVEDSSSEDPWKNESKRFSEVYGEDAGHTWGEDYYFQVKIYSAHDQTIKYPYAVWMGIIDTDIQTCACLPDFPSVLMLIKDTLPLINFDIEKEERAMREEEHKWKAIDENRYHRKGDNDDDRKVRCGHLW